LPLSPPATRPPAVGIWLRKSRTPQNASMAEPPVESPFEQAKRSFFEGIDAFEAGRFEQAEQCFSAALLAVPGRASTLINLAATLLELARPHEALAHAIAALAAEPQSSEAWLHRANALLQLGRLEEALGAFDRLLQIDDRMSVAWLAHAQTLARLGRPMARRLTGLDLSPRMLAKAGKLGVYDDLVQADGIDYLRTTDARFDLVLAADVFIYVGDLQSMFAAAASRMDRGVFCFSVEVLEAGQGDFRLLSNLRYAHAEAYLHRLASEHGFRLIGAQQQPVREEQGQAVSGLFVYLARIATASSH
jgi:tetratricopeptide (TPR) repeat protein